MQKFDLANQIRDPQDDVEFADALDSINAFLWALYNALMGEGVIILHLGKYPDPPNPPEPVTEDANRAKIVDL